ncbi:hypothetical protein ACLOJK_005469 [Asimina triloba]
MVLNIPSHGNSPEKFGWVEDKIPAARSVVFHCFDFCWLNACSKEGMTKMGDARREIGHHWDAGENDVTSSTLEDSIMRMVMATSLQFLTTPFTKYFLACGFYESPNSHSSSFALWALGFDILCPDSGNPPPFTKKQKPNYSKCHFSPCSKHQEHLCPSVLGSVHLMQFYWVERQLSAGKDDEGFKRKKSALLVNPANLNVKDPPSGSLSQADLSWPELLYTKAKKTTVVSRWDSYTRESPNTQTKTIHGDRTAAAIDFMAYLEAGGLQKEAEWRAAFLLLLAFV